MSVKRSLPATVYCLLLTNCVIRVNRGGVERLHLAARPADLDGADAGPTSEADEQTRVVGGKITARARHVKDLFAPGRVRHDDARAETLPVPARAREREAEPVVFSARVAQDERRAVRLREHRVSVAV